MRLVLQAYIEGSSLAGSRAHRTSRRHGVCRCTSLDRRGTVNCRRALSRPPFACRMGIYQDPHGSCRYTSHVHKNTGRCLREQYRMPSFCRKGIGRCLRAQRRTSSPARKGISYAPCLCFITGDVTLPFANVPAIPGPFLSSMVLRRLPSHRPAWGGWDAH